MIKWLATDLANDLFGSTAGREAGLQREIGMQLALNVRGALVVAMSLIAGGFAPASAQADAALYKDNCARCHARAGTLAANLKGQSAEDKASRLDEFLKTHYAEDAQVRAKIVAYLIDLSRK